ncbi:MAG TPA: peptide deformylase, partial [Firmicutes bacterium]|nr:peptide deformylase [Bacillota bacterium]
FLRTEGDRVLRKQAMVVKRFDTALAKLLDDMAESMYHYEGVGLAAPQVGISKQIIVVDAAESGLIELVNPEIV